MRIENVKKEFTNVKFNTKRKCEKKNETIRSKASKKEPVQEFRI